MKKLMKRGQVVNNLQVFIMAIVTIAVILAIGLFVLNEVGDATKEGSCTNVGGYLNTTDGVCQVSSTNATALSTTNTAFGATSNIITKLASTPTWIGILIVVVFASAILAYFYMR